MAEPSLTPDVDVNECFSKLYKSTEQNIPLKVGPWGGSGDSSFDIIGGSTSQIITKVVVYAGDVVDSLEINYFVDYSKFGKYREGGNGGGPKEIPLGKDEYINKISGSVIDYDGETCITQLGFETNQKRSFGPFGNKKGGVGFTIPMDNVRIVGFFGQYTKYINEIGVYVALN